MASTEELVELLIDGARYGDADDVHKALEGKVDVNAADEWGKTVGVGVGWAAAAVAASPAAAASAAARAPLRCGSLRHGMAGALPLPGGAAGCAGRLCGARAWGAGDAWMSEDAGALLPQRRPPPCAPAAALSTLPFFAPELPGELRVGRPGAVPVLRRLRGLGVAVGGVGHEPALERGVLLLGEIFLGLAVAAQSL